MKKFYLLSFMLLVNVMLVVAQTTTHAVQRGETMADIAARYGVTVDALKEANPYLGDKLYVGMKLQIPEKVAATPTVPEQPQPVSYVQQQVENNIVAAQKMQTTDSDATNKSIPDYKKAQGTINAFGRVMFYFTDNVFGKSNTVNGARDYKSDFVLAWDMGANYYFNISSI